MVEDDGDPHRARTARRVLEQLFRWWPAPRDVDADALGLEGADRDSALLAAMETLCDAGLVMYEAVVVRAGVPCFRDAVITPSGCAALRAMQRDSS